MALQPKDPYSRASEMAASWVDETATKLADMLRSDGHAPFAAPVKAADKLHYYDSVFFNPDGTPNVAGRNAEWSRFVASPNDTHGQQIYYATLAQVTKARQDRMNGGTLNLTPPDDSDGGMP